MIQVKMKVNDIRRLCENAVKKYRKAKDEDAVVKVEQLLKFLDHSYLLVVVIDDKTFDLICPG